MPASAPSAVSLFRNIDLILGFDADEERHRLVEPVFRVAVEGVEALPLELETRHEVADGLDLGVGEHRFCAVCARGPVWSGRQQKAPPGGKRRGN
jgi:hypothetical protein